MKPLTGDMLRAIMPKADAARWTPALSAAMVEYEINTPQRRAMFLAQLAHESIELTRTEENLNYSADGLIATFGKRFPDPTLATKYARKPESIANYVYANRNGNGDEASGDGWKFRGRGPIQLTGRTNYREAGKGLGLDLEANPDAVLSALVGSRVAGWYWQTHGCNPLADAGNFTAVTRAINGPRMLGLMERQQYHARALKVLT